MATVTVQIESGSLSIHGMVRPVTYSLSCWRVCEALSTARVGCVAVHTQLLQMHTPSHILIEWAVPGTQKWLCFGACYENMTL